MTNENRGILQLGSIIALFPFLGIFCLYAYELGICDLLKIPLPLIEIDLKKGVLVFVLSVPLLILLIYFSQFFYFNFEKLRRSDTPIWKKITTILLLGLLFFLIVRTYFKSVGFYAFIFFILATCFTSLSLFKDFSREGVINLFGFSLSESYLKHISISLFLLGLVGLIFFQLGINDGIKFKRELKEGNTYSHDSFFPNKRVLLIRNYGSSAIYLTNDTLKNLEGIEIHNNSIILHKVIK